MKDENEGCCPNYRGTGGPWNDWVFAYHNVYCRNGSMLEERESPTKFWRCVQEDGKESEAYVQVCLDRGREKQSVITDSYKFPLKNRRYNGRNCFDVPVPSYIRECFVVHKNDMEEVIVVKPYNEWYRLF